MFCDKIGMKIISTIFYTVFVALVVGIAGLLLGSMLPIPGNVEVKIVKSGSMEPAISTGSLVVVKPHSIYKKGDVITFGKDTKSEVPTTHRVVDLNADGTYTVKGDANEEVDPNPVAKRDVIGKVAFSVPYAGFVLDFARQPIGFALLIAIPAGLVILEEMLTIGKETRKWWRRRRGDDDGEGGSNHETFGTHLKMVYAKRRAMDEIHVPMFVGVRSTRAALVHTLGLHKDAYGTSTALVLGLIFTSTLFAGGAGGTLSYFSDIERSVGNIFRAGTWLPPQLAEEDLVQFAAFSLGESEEEGEVLGVSDEVGEPESPEGNSGSPPEPTAPPETQEEPPADEPEDQIPVEEDDSTGEATPTEAPLADEPPADESAQNSTDEPIPAPEPPPEPTPEPPTDSPPLVVE